MPLNVEIDIVALGQVRGGLGVEPLIEAPINSKVLLRRGRPDGSAVQLPAIIKPVEIVDSARLPTVAEPIIEIVPKIGLFDPPPVAVPVHHRPTWVLGAVAVEVAIDIEIGPLIAPPDGRVVAAPNRVVEGEIGQIGSLEAELIAELPERLLTVLHGSLT